jgi:hypothetical protein
LPKALPKALSKASGALTFLRVVSSSRSRASISSGSEQRSDHLKSGSASISTRTHESSGRSRGRVEELGGWAGEEIEMRSRAKR